MKKLSCARALMIPAVLLTLLLFSGTTLGQENPKGIIGH